jgi:hypothetical protein
LQNHDGVGDPRHVERTEDSAVLADADRRRRSRP